MRRPDLVALPAWMRGALHTTAVMNLVVAFAFVPDARGVRALTGFPEDAPPIYLVTVGLFILLFGLGYLWTAIRGWADPLFIALAAAGKIGFFAAVVWAWTVEAMPLRAPLAAAADLVFGGIFLAWLATVPATRAATDSTARDALSLGRSIS